jgi:triosephosphate isomerase
MNQNHYEAIQCIQKLAYLVGKDDFAVVDVSVHPPFTDIRSVQTLIDADDLKFMLGAQNCHYENSGAFTGEVSPAFLAKLGTKYVICGHSERRELFGETDEMVQKKVAAVLANKMVPILCVGETLAERESGSTLEKVLGQLRSGLAKSTPEQVASLVVAYEPIWAIGTGRTATPEQAQEVHALLRAQLAAASSVAHSVRLLYGGSMKPDNAAALLAQPDIDGGLVGGAALKALDFLAIARAVL